MIENTVGASGDYFGLFFLHIFLHVNILFSGTFNFKLEK